MAHGPSAIVLVPVGFMDFDPPLPSRSAGLRPRLAGASMLAVSALFSIGCTVDEVDADGVVQPSADDSGEAAGQDGDESAEAVEQNLEFGDPGEVDGFEPVTDIDDDPADDRSESLPSLTVDDPEAVIAEVTEQLEAGQIDVEALGGLPPVDQDSAPSNPERDGRSRNEAGELLRLDEAASLACAQIEIALGHLDDGVASGAAERVASASAQAGQSTVAEVNAWAELLRGVVIDGSGDDLATLIGFLSVCTEGGYEL